MLCFLVSTHICDFFRTEYNQGGLDDGKIVRVKKHHGHVVTMLYLQRYVEERFQQILYCSH